MALLLKDVLDFLEEEGLIGGSTGWARAAGFLPPTPNKVIVVYESSGEPPELLSQGNNPLDYDRPAFQVRGRGDVHGYEALREKMGAIFRALHGSQLSPATGDPEYVGIWGIQSGPLPLGLDENSRPELTWNFRAIREREA